MIELPVCRWRHEQLANGNYRCTSAKVIAGRGAPADACRRCPYADHEPVPDEERPTLNVPGPLVQLANWLADTDLWERAGKPVVPDAVKKQRRAICDSCELRIPQTDQCSQCGCLLHRTELGDKLERATAQCPAKKPRWPALIVEQEGQFVANPSLPQS